MSGPDPSAAWIRYLSAVTALVICSGAALVVPGVAEALFGRMVFGSGGFPATFSTPALDYLGLAHAVLGATIAGWFVLVLWLVRVALPRRVPGAWAALVLSVAVWSSLDTTFSLLTGYWQNALLNAGLLLALLPGIVATRPGARAPTRTRAAGGPRVPAALTSGPSGTTARGGPGAG